MTLAPGWRFRTELPGTQGSRAHKRVIRGIPGGRSDLNDRQDEPQHSFGFHPNPGDPAWGLAEGLGGEVALYPACSSGRADAGIRDCAVLPIGPIRLCVTRTEVLRLRP